ncbi:inositol 2-dehydrogenase [Extibacter muris]|uniref:inositol 2-dehydrogenase n=1 Tax=Extibacter muris TaxID=1796622 RepID=UPI001D05E164|nr:inositol 2-dehydrogenase [Extibacter muris]MCB6201903.1 inositol 2-dehydrogenase [Extibacter muris]MCQ4663240.1 inositol 2-dehydrogenase [Extibacter muris]MCQ4692482.1 inositol 2-dehydrogenase [Extibacter muris]
METTDRKRTVKLGMIGAGRMGRVLAESVGRFCDNVCIKTIADIYIDNVKEWAVKLGVENLTADYRDILSDGEIEGVIITTTTDLHAQFIREAAEAGKHIFCEKPIDYDVERIAEALRTVKRHEVKLQVGFNKRFDDDHRKVRQLVEEGAVGDLHIIKSTNRDPALPTLDYLKRSGGFYLDTSIHDYDLIRYVSGSEVKEVYAMGETNFFPELKELGDVDTLVIMMKLENGAIAVIDNSRQAVYGFDQRIEVFGSKGCARTENKVPTTTMLYTADTVESEKPLYFFPQRYERTYAEEISQFARAIAEDTDTPVTGMDGLRPMLIGLAVKESLLKGMPVKVKSPDDLNI